MGSYHMSGRSMRQTSTEGNNPGNDESPKPMLLRNSYLEMKQKEILTLCCIARMKGSAPFL